RDRENLLFASAQKPICPSFSSLLLFLSRLTVFLFLAEKRCLLKEEVVCLPLSLSYSSRSNVAISPNFPSSPSREELLTTDSLVSRGNCGLFLFSERVRESEACFSSRCRYNSPSLRIPLGAVSIFPSCRSCCLCEHTKRYLNKKRSF